MSSQDQGKFTTHLIEYDYQGLTWMIEIQATSWSDAEARLKALRLGKVFGSDAFQVRIPKRDWLAIGVTFVAGVLTGHWGLISL